jgi:predicted Zn finger-like uncharacterized protein
MLTRCPHCQTAFRVTPEQIKMRHGQVRCGTCQQVFNALDSLTDEPPVVITPVVEPEVKPEVIAPPVPEEPSPPTINEPDLQAAVEPKEPVAPPAVEPIPLEMTATPALAPAVPDDSPKTDLDATLDPPVPAKWQELPSPAPRRWPWAIGILAMLLLALLQLVFIYRVELATLAPEFRPRLLAACERVGCQLPYPHKP